MAASGRPKQDGVQPGWMLVRKLMAVEIFQRHRQNGEKHDQALMMTTEDVNKRMPTHAVELSTIKTIIAELFSAKNEDVLIIERIEPLPDCSESYSASFKERPIFPRANKPKPKPK